MVFLVAISSCMEHMPVKNKFPPFPPFSLSVSGGFSVFSSAFLPVCFAIVLKSHSQKKMEEEEEGKVNLQRRQNG